jgi:hypothetical protein
MTASSSSLHCSLQYQGKDFTLEYFHIPVPDAALLNATPQPAARAPSSTAPPSSAAIVPPPAHLTRLSSDEKEKLAVVAAASKLTDHTLPAHHLAKWYGSIAYDVR